MFFGSTAIVLEPRSAVLQSPSVVLEPAGPVLGYTSAILEPKNVFMASESAVLESPGAARRTPGLAGAALEPTGVVLTSKSAALRPRTTLPDSVVFVLYMNYYIKPTIFINNDTCNRHCAQR